MEKNIKKAVLLLLLLSLMNCSSGGGGSSDSSSATPTPTGSGGKITAVKLDNTVALNKTKNELAQYSIDNDVVSSNKQALWMEDNNTKVVNNKTLESNYTRLNLDNDTFVVEVDDRAYFTNVGIIQGNSYGVQLEDGGTMINSGTIRNKADYGVDMDDDTSLYNYGEISNTGNFGVYAEDRAKVINEGTIKNSGSYGIFVSENGTIATNNGTGKIMNTGDFGINTANGAKAVNDGLISNGGNKGMAATNNASVINNGTISNNGTHGMYIVKNSTGVNNGTIELTGTGMTGVYVSDRSTFTNNGTIKINGSAGVGIEAVNNSTIKIAQNSKIILNGNVEITQSNTNYSSPNSNTNAGGTAYKLDSTSQFINAGTISTPKSFSVNTMGRFVLDSGSGVIEAETLDLKKDMYINAGGTLDSSADSFEYKDLRVKNINGNGEIKSDSVLFDAKVRQKADSSYSVMLERKSFGSLFDDGLGEILEKNYSGSEFENGKTGLYNSIKKISSAKSLSLAQEEITGSAIVSNSLYNQFYQDKVINKGIDSVLAKRNSNDTAPEYYFEALGGFQDQKDLDESSGFDGDSYGITAGVMFPVSSNTSLGGFISYLNTDIDYKDNADSSQNVDTFALTGVMENRLNDEFKLITKLGYNYGYNDTKRKITYDNSYREVNGDYESWALGGSTGIEYSKGITENIVLKSSVGFVLDYVSQEAYTETGGAANIKVDSVNSFSAKAGAGIRADMILYNSGVSKFKITPNMNYFYEMADPYKDKNISLVSFTDSMGIWSREAEKNELNLGIDMEYSYNNFSVYTGYRASVLKDTNEQYLDLGFKFFFQ